LLFTKKSTTNLNTKGITSKKSFDNRTKVFEFQLGNTRNQDKAPKKTKYLSDQIMDKIKSKKVMRDMMPKSQMAVIITHIHKMARDYLDKTMAAGQSVC